MSAKAWRVSAEQKAYFIVSIFREEAALIRAGEFPVRAGGAFKNRRRRIIAHPRTGIDDDFSNEMA